MPKLQSHSGREAAAAELRSTGVDHEESALVCGGFMQVYVEPVVPDPTLFIFGAGFVSKAVAHVARFAGFRIAVVDDRIEQANPEKFPEADDFHVDSWEKVFSRLPVNSSSYLFIATRGHRLDLLCLRYAVQSPARYIGILGSPKKTESLFDLLKKEGIPASRFDGVYVPVGFDIGSETAEEIAVSFVAELIATRKNMDIRSMRQSRTTSGIVLPDRIPEPLIDPGHAFPPQQHNGRNQDDDHCSQNGQLYQGISKQLPVLNPSRQFCSEDEHSPGYGNQSDK